METDTQHQGIFNKKNEAKLVGEGFFFQQMLIEAVGPHEEKDPCPVPCTVFTD